ncbi:MAG: hypothetical protein KDD62_09760, partial [Bdellovibrionales bacterium]|nr:hypothetical protein [Bdellovibrionales bacterium]
MRADHNNQANQGDKPAHPALDSNQNIPQQASLFGMISTPTHPLAPLSGPLYHFENRIRKDCPASLETFREAISSALVDKRYDLGIRSLRD